MPTEKQRKIIKLIAILIIGYIIIYICFDAKYDTGYKNLAFLLLWTIGCGVFLYWIYGTSSSEKVSKIKSEIESKLGVTGKILFYLFASMLILMGIVWVISFFKS